MAESREDKEHTGKEKNGDISDEDLEKMLDDFEYLMTKSYYCGK